MLTNVKIENFRGFRHFETDVAPVTAFLGPNSSGKTTVLHAIRLACDMVQLAATEGTSTIRSETDDGNNRWVVIAGAVLLGDHSRLLPFADWRALFVDQRVRSGTHLTIALSFSPSDFIQGLVAKITCASNEQLKLDVKVRSAGLEDLLEDNKSAATKSFIARQVRESCPVAVFVPPFYGTVLDEEYRARAVIDRLLGSGDQSHVVRNLVAGLEPSQFERLNSFLESSVGARLTYRTAGDALQTESPLVVKFRDTNGDVEVSAAGAGLVNLIALYASLSRWRLESQKKPVLFLLDEPEAHLHPRLQADSAEQLGQLVTKEFNAQLLLATHSVDILNRLSTNGALLIRADRTRTPSAVCLDSHSSLFDDLATWVDLTPYTAINFLASRRIVFCEGDDDLVLLPKLAELRYRNDPKRADRFRQWSIVKLGGVSNRPIASLLKRLVQNDAIRTQAKKDRFEIVVLLDRDWERATGKQVEVSSDTNITETTFVWSRHSMESLFVEPTILAQWVRAFVGEAAPDDLLERLRLAVADANSEKSLNEHAKHELVKTAVLRMLDKNPGADGGRALVEAQRNAAADVEREPEVYQRGKDRAQLVLGKIREAIARPTRNQFPTHIVRLIEKADLNRIGDVNSAIPAEVTSLLDLLTSDPPPPSLPPVR